MSQWLGEICDGDELWWGAVPQGPAPPAQGEGAGGELLEAGLGLKKC